MEMVIARLFKLASIKNKFSLDHKELNRSKAIVDRQFAEEQNENYLNNGNWYEIDEEETIAWRKRIAEKNAIKTQIKEFKQAAATTLISDVLAGAIEEKIKKGKK